jgi:hypothetical protein
MGALSEHHSSSTMARRIGSANAEWMATRCSTVFDPLTAKILFLRNN